MLRQRLSLPEVEGNTPGDQLLRPQNRPLLRPAVHMHASSSAMSDMEWQGVLRSKGFFWLATRHDIMGAWQTAGTAWQGEPKCVREDGERKGKSYIAILVSVCSLTKAEQVPMTRQSDLRGRLDT
eukprot:scaffold6743_cov17-Tisochrysis_lutea.AAC.2